MGSKWFKGTKTFNSYKELCQFLEIEPAPRGLQKENQLLELSAHYDITRHKSGRYTVAYITQRERERREGIYRGWIQTIDGVEVNLRSPNCYQHTGIDQYILHCALTAATSTKTEFYLKCFHQSEYFQRVLCSDYAGAGCLTELKAKYPVNVLAAADEIISTRLAGKADYLLEDFVEKGYIRINQFYLLSDGTHATIEEIQPYVNQALENLGFESEFHACRLKAYRKKYFLERNRLYQEGEHTDLKIYRKELHIIPLIGPKNPNYPNIGPEAQEAILRKFFPVLRAKLVYDLDTKEKYHFMMPLDRKGLHKQSVAQQIAEVINQYCVYAPGGSDFDANQYDYYAVCNLLDDSEESGLDAEITGGG